MVGLVWSLAPDRQRNYLLAYIGDSKDRHTDRQEASFLHNVSLRLSPSLIAMLSQLYCQPFGMPYTFHSVNYDKSRGD